MNPDFFKEFAEDLLAIGLNHTAFEVGVRIGHPILRHAFDKIPEQVIKNTNYNRQTLKWFKYIGMDGKRRELVFSSRLRVMKFENKPWPLRGTWNTYDNAWDVISGLNLEVRNRVISAHVNVRNTNSDWPSGLGGVFLSVFDIFGGTLSWMFTGQFTTFSDIIGKIGGLVFNFTDIGNISGYFLLIDDLNKLGLIYLDRTDYSDAKGPWFWFKTDSARIEEAKRYIEDYFRDHGWM